MAAWRAAFCDEECKHQTARLGNAQPRLLRQLLRQNHRSPIQPGIAQRQRLKFFFGPVRHSHSWPFVSAPDAQQPWRVWTCVSWDDLNPRKALFESFSLVFSHEIQGAIELSPGNTTRKCTRAASVMFTRPSVLVCGEDACCYGYSQDACCLFQRPPLSKQSSILSCSYNNQNPIKKSRKTSNAKATFSFILRHQQRDGNLD